MWQWGCTFSTNVDEPSDVSFEIWGYCMYACLGDGRGENFWLARESTVPVACDTIEGC
jgi:hypothetical protein